MEKAMENGIGRGMEIVGLSLFFRNAETLVVSDPHLGYEEGKRKEGVLVPHFNYAAVQQQVQEIFRQTGKVKRVIINGDLKHEFGKASAQEWEEILDLVEFLQGQSGELIVVRGQHDLNLGPVMKWKGVRIHESYFLPEEETCFTHGNKLLGKEEMKKTRRIVIGNEHPAVSVREGVKKETYKCFLKGSYKGKELVVLPSLSSATLGSDVLREQRISPYLKQDISDFEVWAVEDRPYYFGKLKNLQ